MVRVLLFPLNVGFSPCFHCTVLVSVYKAYTSCFHNTVFSSSYVLHTSYLHHAGLLINSVWTSGFNLFLKCAITPELMREYTHIYDQFIMFLYDRTWCQLHLRDVACSANSYANCYFDIYQDTYLRHTVSIGNGFSWLYINCFQFPWFQCTS